MGKPVELDEMADHIKVGISLHPDTLMQYRQCMNCGWDHDCESCMYSEGLDAVMIQFLRPRPMMPSLG
jgi:hypothetical protein